MPDFIKQKGSLKYDFLNAKECLNILTEAEKDELVKHKTDVEFEPGEIIIKRGILANNILYLTEGLLKLEIINDEKPYTIGLIQSSSFIGIVCCFAFKKYDFTATAIEKTTVSFIEMATIEKFIKTNGDFALHLIKHMSGVTNGLFHRITKLSQKNIEGAIALQLLDFSEIYNSLNYTLPVVRKELGEIVGYSKESVINTLSKFNKEEIIKVNDRKITILDKDKLAQISKLG
ncbi:Crp/Fnr family transcriptional regulator [Lutibacter sp. B1]|uniref:Crp/Fnr family transcriptional regulator n=1 Tax=Lutibacter sp. B1 TaxID=2725996 RepID=UPI00145677C0|nr:Crp/Fnr family transcriptional regulator [Lutibacter sp. B1]NLP56918.1 Crp/Fnr family transcriptional regulator [Lutibacter sp. B1]